MQAQVAQPQGLAIYIPRVRWPRMQGQLDVFVNGVRLDADSIVWNSPVILNVPDAIVAHADKVEVLVALSIAHGQSGGISRIWIGSADELRVRHGWRQFFQQRMPQVTGISFGILGVFAFIFWLYRLNESAYLLFAIAAALNVLRNLHYYLADDQFACLVDACGALVRVPIARSAIPPCRKSTDEQRSRRFDRLAPRGIGWRNN
jgi:hypothetical protein